MIDKTLKSAVKVLKPQIKTSIEKPTIENWAFKLNSKCTAMILLALFFLVCARDYFGDHIQCISDKLLVPKILNNYCFFMSTFTYDFGDNRHWLEGNHRGIGPGTPEAKTVKHKYYQWVPFMLFFQCICFYIPHYIWKRQEGGRMKALLSSLESARIAVRNEEVKVKDKVMLTRSALTKKVEVIGKDILLRLQVTRSWSVCLVFLEVLYFLHLLLQIWLTNRFLSGYFLTFGYDWIVLTKYKLKNEKDPLSYAFPKVTKCVFNKFGPSGSVQTVDAMCVLSLNVVYEKIYVFLWFWFLLLLTASVLSLIWRVCTMMLYNKTRFTQRLYRRVTPGKLKPEVIGYVISKCHYADWLFLYYLAKNMPGFVFEELFNRLKEELQKKEREKDESIGNDDTLPLKKKVCENDVEII